MIQNDNVNKFSVQCIPCLMLFCPVYMKIQNKNHKFVKRLNLKYFLL